MNNFALVTYINAQLFTAIKSELELVKILADYGAGQAFLR